MISAPIAALAFSVGPSVPRRRGAKASCFPISRRQRSADFTSITIPYSRFRGRGEGYSAGGALGLAVGALGGIYLAMDDTYLKPGRLIESDDPTVAAFAKKVVGDESNETQKALKLFYAVRDDVRYDAYLPLGDIESYSGKEALVMGKGWCVSKAALLAACARAEGIPARPGYADVRNHLATEKLTEAMGTDVFFWHSYCELLLDGKWVKCTPAFNKSLCDKFGLKTLDFDGKTDSLFHAYDKVGNKHMEYIHDRGPFIDVPFEDILATFRNEYRNMQDGIDGDFEADAAEE